MSNVLLGCVAENNPVFYRRALNLVRSIRWFGGLLATADIVVCVVDGVSAGYREGLEAAGARVRVVPRRPGKPMSDTVSFFTLPELPDYETVVLLDCDRIVVQDLTPFFRPGVIQSTVANGDGVPTLACGHTATTIGPPALLAEMVETGVPFAKLPVALDFPLDHGPLPATPEMAACDPVVVHYHQATDERGCLHPAPPQYPLARERVRLFNERVARAATPSRTPIVFLVGSGESGTSLLGQMLDHHPQLAIVSETGVIPRLARECPFAPDPAARFLEIVVGQESWALLDLDPERLRERVTALQPFDLGEAIRAFYDLYALRLGKTRGGDCTPSYALHVERIQELLPEAHFIHLIRDGRAMVPSSGHTASATQEVEAFAQYWVSRVEAVQRRAPRLAHHLEVRYDELVSDTEAVLRRVCEFLDLPFEAAMPPVDAPKERPREPLTPELRRRFEIVAGPLLDELGYERVGASDDADPRPTPAVPLAVCITGMHRSGTSAIAGILHSSGILLGGPSRFLPPAEDNPLGFWEEQEFVLLNEALLAARGGGWDLPPEDAPGWERSSALLDLRARALALVEAREEDGRPWGVKDPRAMLNLPFWKLIVPHLRLVVCLRNPLAVARSLARRNGMSQARALRLWESYHRALRHATTPAERIVTAYESYGHAPAAALRRVLTALGVRVSAEAEATAAAAMVPSLLHHQATAEDLVASGAPDSVVSLYLDLSAEAADANAGYGVEEGDVATALALSTRDEYRTILRQFRADHLLAVLADEIARLKAQVDEAQGHLHREVAVAAQAVEQSRAWEWHYRELRRFADELEHNHAVLRTHADELGRHARGLETAAERQRLRNLVLRLFHLGRRAVHRPAGKNG